MHIKFIIIIVEIKFKELNPEIQIESKALKIRAESSKTEHTRHFIILHGDAEAAFLGPRADYLVLYEIFVDKPFRNRGLGSIILRETEKLAKRLGYRKIVLHPEPLDEDVSKGRLLSWYTQRGYLCSKHSNQELEKPVL